MATGERVLNAGLKYFLIIAMPRLSLELPSGRRDGEKIHC